MAHVDRLARVAAEEALADVDKALDQKVLSASSAASKWSAAKMQLITTFASHLEEKAHLRPSGAISMAVDLMVQIENDIWASCQEAAEKQQRRHQVKNLAPVSASLDRVDEAKLMLAALPQIKAEFDACLDHAVKIYNRPKTGSKLKRENFFG